MRDDCDSTKPSLVQKAESHRISSGLEQVAQADGDMASANYVHILAIMTSNTQASSSKSASATLIVDFRIQQFAQLSALHSDCSCFMAWHSHVFHDELLGELGHHHRIDETGDTTRDTDCGY